MSDKIVVLGGSGFIGSAIVKEVRKRGNHEVISVGFSRGGDLKADILDFSELERVCNLGNIIINCTGQITNPIDLCLRQNSIGILNLAKISNIYRKKILHLSTVSVYGTTGMATEESNLNPETPYSTSKYFAEFLLRQNVDKKMLGIVRLSNVYGLDGKGVLNYLLESYLENKPLFFNNNGLLERFYMHVDDCAFNLVNLIESKQYLGLFNLVGEEKLSLKDLVKLIKDNTGYSFDVKYEDKIPYENIGNISTEKIRSIINLKFENNLSYYVKNYFVRGNE